MSSFDLPVLSHSRLTFANSTQNLLAKFLKAKMNMLRRSSASMVQEVVIEKLFVNHDAKMS